MRKRTKLAAGAGAALAAVGAGGAIAATQGSPREESKAVVEDAAKQLGISPAELNAALAQALGKRIDEAVTSGRLPEELGEKMKQQLESGEFPLFGGPLGGRHGGRHGAMKLRAAATYLGLSGAEVRQALRDGKTLAQLAKDHGKSVDGLVDALVAAGTKRLDEGVASGKLTNAQRDQLVARLEQRMADLVNGIRPSFGEKRGSDSGSAFRPGGFELPPAA